MFRTLIVALCALPLLLGACGSPATTPVPTPTAGSDMAPTEATGMPVATDAAAAETTSMPAATDAVSAATAIVPAETAVAPAVAAGPTVISQDTSTIVVQDPFVRPSVDLPTNATGQGQGGGVPLFGEGTSLIFLMLINQSDTPDALTAVTTDAASTVEFFQTQPVRQINVVEQIDIPASGAVVISEGPGYRIVLTELTRELRVGDNVTFTLSFQNAGDVTLTAPVRLPREVIQE